MKHRYDLKNLSLRSRSGANGAERARGRQDFTMDLRVYAGVLWRNRLLVAVGFAVALALALLSVVRVSSDGFAYRKPVIWTNKSVVNLSQESFPEGFCAPAEHGARPVHHGRRSVRSACNERRGHCLSKKAAPDFGPTRGKLRRSRSPRPRFRLA